MKLGLKLQEGMEGWFGPKRPDVVWCVCVCVCVERQM